MKMRKVGSIAVLCQRSNFKKIANRFFFQLSDCDDKFIFVYYCDA